MTPEEAIQVADEVLLAHAGSPLTDIQRMILRESLANKGYESMKGYAPQHIKNEGKKLWDLLSEALREKVSKTSFKGALEKRLKSGNVALKSPEPSNYDEQTWAGREVVVNDLLTKLQENTRILWLTGISGIGKTALGECLAIKAWEHNPSFQWIYLEILEGQSIDFVSVAADLLSRLGEDDIDPQERNNSNQMIKRLLNKLKSRFYWIQIDSLERLLNSEQPIKFLDPYWIIFFRRYLTESNLASRLVLTAQVFPNELVEFDDRYKAWLEIRLDGLLQEETQLEFFIKRGLSVASSNNAKFHDRDILIRIAKIYEGHPLVLKVISEDILKDFEGNVNYYWQVHQIEFEQVARELQAVQLNETEYNEALNRKVRERIKQSLEQLPSDALDLLCRSAVFRRPVPKEFWLALIGDFTLQQQESAYRVLSNRALVEKEYTDIRQHNLISAVAYDLLKRNFVTWQQTERQAAYLWLNLYEPALDSPKLELVRGSLEAFYHYCAVKDWEPAKQILFEHKFGLKLQTWGEYQTIISCCKKILQHLQEPDEMMCKMKLGNTYFFLSDFSKSIEYYLQALEISQAIDDRTTEGKMLGNLGLAFRHLGKYEESIDFQEKRLKLARDINDRRGEGRALGNLGSVYYMLKDYDNSLKYHEMSKEIAQTEGDFQGEIDSLANLGEVYRSTGNYEQALQTQNMVLGTIRKNLDLSGDGYAMKRAEGYALKNLGDTQIKLYLYQDAQSNLDNALLIFRETGERHGEAETLKNFAELHQALGSTKKALEYCHQALILSKNLDIPLAKELEEMERKIRN